MQQSKAKPKPKAKANQTEWTTGPGADNRKPQRWLPQRDALRQSKCTKWQAEKGESERERGKRGQEGKPVATVRLLFVPLSVARVALG